MMANELVWEFAEIGVTNVKDGSLEIVSGC